MQKLKIGILGGTRGLDFLTRVLLNHPYAEVTSICEKFDGLREKIESEAKSFSDSIKVYSDYDIFLQSGIDAVIIANFANEHAPYAIKALNSGINVFSENLPSQTMKEAVGLVEAVERSGKIYAYGENYCYLPHVLEMRRIFDSGEMGELMYAEGNFINDCSYKWHLLTRGDRNHWRNFVPSTFYCTHSIGPLMFVSGRRAVNVVGMETQLMPHMSKVGARSGSAAVELMQFDNGAAAKSMNGNYRRDYSADYRFIAENGTVETNIYSFGELRISKANNESSNYKVYFIKPPYFFNEIPLYSYKDLSDMNTFEIADVYLINIFIQTLLGNDAAKKYMIDVYRALDMSTVGLLAYRSILNNSNSVKVPDLRNEEERNLWRNDNCSTDASLSFGKDLLPSCKSGFVEVDDSVYKKIQDRFNDTPLTSGSH